MSFDSSFDSSFDGSGAAANTGAPSLALSVAVTATGSPALQLRVSVGVSGAVNPVTISASIVDAGILSGSVTVADSATGAASWSPIVTIDGVDNSADVIGLIDVEASEGDARIASFTLAIAPGTTVDLPSYVGSPVTIDIADGAGENRMRLFTGRLDLPDLDLATRSIRCRCTDDLQSIIAAAPRAWMDTMIGGRWSPAVFDKGAEGWAYAQDRLSTVASSLDISPLGQVRVTPWLAKSIADLSFDATEVLDGSVAVSFAERSALVNQVTVDFGYRFPRIKTEGYHIVFSYMTNGFAAWVSAGNGFLFRSAVLEAIANAGGTVVSMTWVPLPTTAQIVGGGFWIPNPATDPLMCLGFDAVVSFDYVQDVDEAHAIRVFNQSSIDAVGLIVDQMRGALVGETLDNSAAETNILLYKSEITKIPPLTAATVVSGSVNAAAIALTTETDRAAADSAMETLIDVAKTKIAGSHRTSSVSASVALNPVIDVDKTISVAAQGVAAIGKCIRVRHLMDADSGAATSDFSIALCTLTGLGIADPGDQTAAPAGTADGVTATLAAPTCVYNGLLGQDQSFTVTFPAVANDQRNKSTINYAVDVAAPLFEDVLTITV